MPSDQWSFLGDDDELASEQFPLCCEEAAIHLEDDPPHGLDDPGSVDVEHWTPADEIRTSGLAEPLPDEQPEWAAAGSDDEVDGEPVDLEDLLEIQH